MLGRADLRDFDKRRKYAAVEARFPHEAGEQRVSLLQNIPIRIRDQSHYGSVAQLAEEEVHSRSQEPHEIPDPKSNQSPRKMEHEADPSDDDEDEHDDLWPQGNLGKASENATSLFHQPSSPDKHIFYYGGFVETPGVAQLNNSLNSSPYGKLVSDFKAYYLHRQSL